MRTLLKIFPLIFFFAVGCKEDLSVDPQNRISTLPVIEGKIKREFYDQLLVNRHMNTTAPIDLYFEGELIRAEVEPQGAGSRYYPKWSYEVFFSPEQNIFGLNHFNLSAQIADEAMILTTLTSHVYRKMGFLVFKSEDVFFHLNGEDQGLYKIIERVNPDFFIRRGLPLYELIKVGFEAKFTFDIPNDLTENFDVDYPDGDNYENLVQMIDAIDKASPSDALKDVSKHLDIDNYLKYHAIATIIGHVDGFKNNMFFYKSSWDSPYEVIPWDFDRTFNEKMGEIYFGKNEIVEKLFQNETCRKIYKDHYFFFLENVFTESELYPVIDSAYTRIKEGYYADPYLGLGGRNLEKNIKKYKDFITSRRNLLLSSLNEFPF